MEVAIPSPARDFDFNSGRSSPCVTSPSTPKAFGDFYFSAPTSPSRVSQLYRDFDVLAAAEAAGAVPKSPGKDDFVFDVASEDWETTPVVAADELFDGGVIKPLKPPPTAMKSRPSVISPSPIRIIQGAFSPRRRSKKKTAGGGIEGESEAVRGRPEMPKSTSRRAARSLSPLRDPRYPWEEENSKEVLNRSVAQGGVKKWRLMDFFLFRSASEGRAADKDPLKKYTAALRHSSFRAGEGSGSGSRRKGRVSAHEVHYTVNRAVSEDLKKKTFLPYKQGILGRLAFNPAVHALANGFGFSRK